MPLALDAALLCASGARPAHDLHPWLVQTSEMRASERMAGRRAERAKMEEALRREMGEKYALAPSCEDSDKQAALSMSGLVAGVSFP